MLRQLATPEQRERLVRALDSWGPESETCLAKRSAWASLPFDAREVEHLRAIIRRSGRLVGPGLSLEYLRGPDP